MPGMTDPDGIEQASRTGSLTLSKTLVGLEILDRALTGAGR